VNSRPVDEMSVEDIQSELNKDRAESSQLSAEDLYLESDKKEKLEEVLGNYQENENCSKLLNEIVAVDEQKEQLQKEMADLLKEQGNQKAEQEKLKKEQEENDKQLQAKLEETKKSKRRFKRS